MDTVTRHARDRETACSHGFDKYDDPRRGVEDASSFVSLCVYYYTLFRISSATTHYQQLPDHHSDHQHSTRELSPTPSNQITHSLTAVMDRRQDYNNYHRSSESSRQWSDEAVRGSWDSSFQRASAVSSPPDQTSSMRRISPNAYDRRQNMVNQWLGQQQFQQHPQEPTVAMDAASDFTTPTTSPAISDSATFTSRTGDYYQMHATTNDYLAPPSRNSVPYRPYDNGAPSSSRDPAPRTMDYRTVDYRQTDYHQSEDQDLRGIGAFASTDSSRYVSSTGY